MPASQKYCTKNTKTHNAVLQGSKGTAIGAKPIQKQAVGNAPSTASKAMEERLNTPTGGASLPENTRSFMESRMGTDFSEVRIHTDQNAIQMNQELGAQAFAHGNNIYFNKGKFNPESTSGKHLLAHELVHTKQQEGIQTKRIQRALSCSLSHIDTECKGAAASCMTVEKSYCSTKYPTQKDKDTLYSNARKGAKKQAGKYPHAAKNLNHFLDGTGSEMTMPTAIFTSNSNTKSALSKHLDKFKAGAVKRLKSNVLAPGKNAEMVWTDTANAFSFFSTTDLGIAVGGYTLCSKVEVEVTAKKNGNFNLKFVKWNTQAFDCYNWDPGKGIGIPEATDNDLCCLQNNGKAKHFKIKTAPWAHTVPDQSISK